VQRVEKQMERMDEANIKYARTIYDPIFTASLDDDKKLKVELTPEVPGLDIYYSFDESNPDMYYPKYQGVLTVPQDAVNLKVMTYRNGKPVGRQINMPVEELQKRAERNRK
jgi:hexosaminidase